MTPQFYTKAGKLTRYGLACGYIEQKKYSRERPMLNPYTARTELYRTGTIYHVRTVHTSPYTRIWETFDTLTEARRAYSIHIKRYHN